MQTVTFHSFPLIYLSDLPDEEKNGEANDYNDDYEDDFNPTRCRLFNYIHV